MNPFAAPPRRWLWRAGTLIALVAILGGTVASQWTAFRGGVLGSVAPDRIGAGLPGVAVPLLPSPHVSAAAIATVRYNSNPPTSGPHYPFVAAPGIYASPVPDGLAVHALEHGHIVLDYTPGVATADLATLRAIAKRYPRDVVLTPHAGLNHPIALTAWGRLETLGHADEPEIVTFIERLRGRYNHGWTRADTCVCGVSCTC